MSKKTKISLFSLVIIALLAFAGFWFQNSRSEDSDLVKVKFNPISPTDYHDTPKRVYPLTVEFSGPAAPIDKLQKEITQGVGIKPAIQGRWEWKTDRTLTFTPADDWPAGQEYKVTLDESMLNPKLDYAKSVGAAHTVQIPPFKARLQDEEFYQDPNQAHVRQSIVSLSFTHPADRQKLEKAVTVNLVRKNKDDTQDTLAPLNFKIRYSDDGLRAWIVSDNVSLANSDNQYIQTKIDKNLTALSGVNTLRETLIAEVAVPTRFSLDYDNRIRYVNNREKEAEQLLAFDFNRPVKGADLAANLRVLLLPEQDRSWAVKNLIRQVLEQAEEVNFDLIPTETVYAEQQNLRIDIPQNRCVYVSVNNQFSAQGGYQLAKALGSVTCAGEYPHFVGFVGEGSVLSLSGEKKITLAARNFDKIRLDIGRVQGEQLRHIANLNDGTFQKPDLGNLKFDDIADFSSVTFNLPNTEPGKSHYESFNLDRPGGFPAGKGIFWLKASGLQNDQNSDRTSRNKDAADEYDWRNDGTEQYTDYRLIILTDLGIIAKKAADGSQTVFVQSVRSGEPVINATVKVISRNGSAVESAHTDESGMARIPALENYKQELEPVMYLVEFNGDQSFLPIGKQDRALNYSRFDVGGVMTEKDTTELKAQLINDRGIYRPNETLHAAVITKAADWNAGLSRIPLQLEIYGPDRRVAFQQTLHLSDNGFNAFDYTLPENAETGQWLAQLYITRQNLQTPIGSMKFQVQEFQPDTLKISTRFNAQETQGWVSPNDLSADVHLTNLFGTPAQNRRVRASLTLHSLFPKFARYEDYQFYDNRRNKSAILYETELNEQYTDAKGDAKFALDLGQYAENTVQILYFTAEGFETDSGRGVSGMKSVLVSAQPWLVGYHSKQDLDYLKQNAAAEVHLIAVNPQLEKIAAQKLTATLFERKYVSVLTRQDSGAYKYESKLAETQKAEAALDITQEGITFPLDTQASGDFVLVLTNELGQEVNRINYSVLGNQNVSTEMAKNTELKLKLNKKQFRPGEEIEVVINAPYAGNGLITVERDRVYAHQWFKADTTQSVQRIKLPDNFEGNGYVNVQFTRDINSADIFTSPLSYGVEPFTVNVDNHRLNLKLDVPKQVKSGETVEFRLTTDKPGKAVIYAVNEGILQVAGYQLKDPLKFFFPKHALQVETLQILDLILPEFSKIMHFAQTGGDADFAEMASFAKAIAAKNTNPFKRKADKPVAYWSGMIDVDGEHTVSYRVPEGFNGNLKVMAIAVSDDSDNIGVTENATLVRDDVILSPTVPLTLTPTDQSQVSVSVANNTDTSQKIKVKLTPAPQIAIIGDGEKTVDVPAMSESAVSFEIKATERVGVADLRISAAYQDVEIVRNISVSVRPTRPKQLFTYIGKVDGGKQTTTALPALLYPQQRSQTAVFSPAPLALSQGISAYLADYDNYCTEQIISSAMPTLLFANNPAYQPLFNALANSEQNDLTGATRQDMQKSLQKVFGLLPDRQMENGEFGTWDNITESDPFVTAYAAHFLIEAQEHGQRLPDAWFAADGLFNNSVRALENQSMPREGDSLKILRQRAYSAYLLTRLVQVPSNALMSIRSQLDQNFKPADWQTDLTAAWLAAAYQNLRQEEEATKLIEPVLAELVKPRTNKWQYRYYSDPLIDDSSALYVIARHFPAKLSGLSDTVLARIGDDINARRYNTLSSAMVLLALDAYGQNAQTDAEQLQITLNDRPAGQLQGVFRFADVEDEKAKLSFVNQSARPAWFAVSQNGYPQQANEAAVKNGLEIDRTYTDKDGKEVTTVKIGETVDVTVKLRATDGFVSDVVITDLFPAGFEAVWNADTEDSDDNLWSPAHTDLREDRMLSYGDVGTPTRYLKYRLKAVNAGTFQIPSAYAESMYDRSINALSAGKGSIKVTK